MTEFETNKRCGKDRRKFNYTRYIPERRSGKDRRIAKNGQKVSLVKLADESGKEERQDLIIRK